MRYAVAFEMQSDLGDTVSETVYKALVSVLGRIDDFKIEHSGSTYIGYIQGNRPIIWHEVRRDRAPDV
jgi:hypothetical protein